MLRKRLALTAMAFAMAFFCPVSAFAEEAPESEEPPGRQDGEFVLEEVVVRKLLRVEELRSTSATVLGNKDITDRIYVTPLDMLRLSPGVTINQFSEGGVPAMVRIRGFDGSHLPDIGFYLDGVPMNDADKYADTNTVIPLEIESLDVIKGPASVLYGNHSSGGTVSYHTYTKGDFARFKVTGGSNNTWDASGIAAKTIGQWDHVYAFQAYYTEGFRRHSDWEKYNLSTKWTYNASDDLYFRFGFRAHYSEWDSGGYIPHNWNKKKAVTDATGKGNGGDKHRVEGRLEVNYDMDKENNLNAFVWGVSQEYNRYYMFQPSPGQTADRRSTHMDQGTNSWGVKAAYNFSGDIFGRDTLFSFGFEYQREDEDRKWWNLAYGQGHKHVLRGGYLTYRNNDFIIETTSLYADLNYQILDSLNIRLATRYDYFDSEIKVREGDEMALPGKPGAGTHGGETLQGFSPKLGLLYTPLDWLDLYANYGRSLALPNPQYALFDDTESTPRFAKREQYEFGFRTAFEPWVKAGAACYILDTENDLTRDPQTFIFSNAGKTRRQGVETFIDFTPWDDWLLHLDYTYQDAKYKKHFDPRSGQDMKDRRIPNVPRHITNAELSFEPETGLGGRIRYSWYADFIVYDDPRYGEWKGRDYGSLDLQASYRVNETMRITLDVLNVLDKDSEAWTADHTPTGANAGYYTYAPNPPLTVYLGLELDWD